MIQTSQLTKTYTKKNQQIHALNQCDLHIHQGDFVVIYGHSGSGKSTLLLMLGGMLRPTTGSVLFNEKNIYANSSFLRNTYRKQTVGFMFQKFYLMPYLTVLDNIRLSLSLRKAVQADDRIYSVTNQLGLSKRLHHLPTELSVGEQQRAALARSLAGNPELILADEPTGNLDAENSRIIVECMRQENEQGKTIILVTHEETFMPLGTKRFQLISGEITDID